MSNGIHVEATTNNKLILTVFLQDVDKTWVEFDKQQAKGLIKLLQEKIKLIKDDKK